MDLENTYQLTARGESELRGGGTRLSAAEIALLVRFDGVLTLAQLQAGLSPRACASFEPTFRRLRDRRLLALVEVDPFESRFQPDLDRLSALVGGPETEAHLASLQRAGFYVQIARERPTRRRRAPGERLVAVVVEDEPILARFIATLLTLSDFEVRVAADRASVVAALRQAPVPDLVLLDVMLPDADGFDILLRLRQHPALAEVPVVMLTGKATRQAVIKGMAAGADGYITKPFEAEALLRVVRTVLALPEEGPAGRSANDPWVNADAKALRPVRRRS